MNTRARRTKVAVSAAALSLLTFSSVAQSSPTGTTFTLDHAIHPDVLNLTDYIEDPVGTELANAVQLFTRDRQRCNYSDNTVCPNSATTHLGTFGISDDGHLDIDDSTEANSVALTSPEARIKIVGVHNLWRHVQGG